MRLATERIDRSRHRSAYGNDGMSLMWMPAQTTTPPGASAAQRRRHERADGREDDRGVELLRRRGADRSPAHSQPSERANACAAVVAGAGEGEHAPPLVERDLADDVRRGAEAVEAEALGVAGHPQRAVADQPGAEQRRGLEVAVAVGQREAEARVGDGRASA